MPGNGDLKHLIKKYVVLGTKNVDKLRELKRLLRGSGVRVLSLADFPDCPDVAEDGKTFEANARKKARVYSRHVHGLALADDSGLMVSALNGKPGVTSARFAGTGCTYHDNNKKLLQLLKNKDTKRRGAKFVCAVALYDSGRPVAAVKKECRGHIALGKKGTRGFGYDPVFIPNGFTKTFAELSASQKNKISHRARALRALRTSILNFYM